jgi:hypothetical protein
MNYEETKLLLRQYLLARIPFISIKTIEKSRALNILKELAIELNLPINVHSMSKGVTDIATNNLVSDEKNIMGVLDYIGEQVKIKENNTFVLTDASELENETLVSRYLNDIVTIAEEKGGSIIVITTSPIWTNLQRLGMNIELDLPTETELFTLIKEISAPYQGQITIEWDDNNFKEAATILLGLSEIEVKNVIASLIAKGSLLKTDLVDLKFAKDSMFSEISGLEKIEVDPTIAFGGLEGLKEWLDEKRKLLSPDKKEEMKRRGIKPPRGILIVGVPGCGKSLSAKAIAAKWQMPLYLLDFATVQGRYVGQSEQQLKEALETAEYVSPCILWIDEIEKGLSGTNGDSGVTNRMIGQFLFWLQECKKEVFVVATANDVNSLPAELLRKGRFDEMFFVDLPSELERSEIIKLYLAKYLNVKINDDFVNQLVTISNGFAGSDIESCIREIAYQVIANNIQLTQNIFVDTFNKTVSLSKTNPEKIEKIRAWGKEHAISASKKSSI